MIKIVFDYSFRFCNIVRDSVSYFWSFHLMQSIEFYVGASRLLKGPPCYFLIFLDFFCLNIKTINE